MIDNTPPKRPLPEDVLWLNGVPLFGPKYAFFLKPGQPVKFNQVIHAPRPGTLTLVDTFITHPKCEANVFKLGSYGLN